MQTQHNNEFQARTWTEYYFQWMTGDSGNGEKEILFSHCKLLCFVRVRHLNQADITRWFSDISVFLNVLASLFFTIVQWWFSSEISALVDLAKSISVGPHTWENNEARWWSQFIRLRVEQKLTRLREKWRCEWRELYWKKIDLLKLPERKRPKKKPTLTPHTHVAEKNNSSKTIFICASEVAPRKEEGLMQSEASVGQRWKHKFNSLATSF